MPRRRSLARASMLALCVVGSSIASPMQVDENEIFLLPERFNAIRMKLAARQNALRHKKLDEAELRSAEAVRIIPGLPETLLFLAGTQAERGEKEKAFETLSKAVDAGMNNVKTLEQPVFAKLKAMDGWDKLVERSKTAKRDATAIWRRPAVPVKAKRWRGEGRGEEHNVGRGWRCAGCSSRYS